MASTQFYEGQEFPPKDPNSGLPVLVYRGGKLVPKGGAGAAAKVAPEDTKALTEMTADAIQRQHLADRAGKFMAVQRGNGGTATGPIYGELNLPLVGNINPMEALGKIFSPKLSQLDSINNQTWPELRPIGSGPIRNYEAGGFKTAFPSTANYGTTNDDIAQRLQDEAAAATKKTAFVSNFVRQGKGSVADALVAYTGGQADPKAAANAALKAKSAATRGPAVIDINGNPVSQ